MGFMFERKGLVRVALGNSDRKSETRLEQLVDAALEAGAEEFEEIKLFDSTAVEVRSLLFDWTSLDFATVYM